MKAISIAEDIVPIGRFKIGLAEWFKKVREGGHPLVITQNGKPAGVLISPADYDELVYRQAFLESVQRGLEDAAAGRVMDRKELEAELEKARLNRRKK